MTNPTSMANVRDLAEVWDAEGFSLDVKIHLLRNKMKLKDLGAEIGVHPHYLSEMLCNRNPATLRVMLLISEVCDLDVYKYSKAKEYLDAKHSRT